MGPATEIVLQIKTFEADKTTEEGCTREVDAREISAEEYIMIIHKEVGSKIQVYPVEQHELVSH